MRKNEFAEILLNREEWLELREEDTFIDRLSGYRICLQEKHSVKIIIKKSLLYTTYCYVETLTDEESGKFLVELLHVSVIKETLDMFFKIKDWLKYRYFIRKRIQVVIDFTTAGFREDFTPHDTKNDPISEKVLKLFPLWGKNKWITQF